MYSEELEDLIDAIIRDGVLTDKERQVLARRAEKEGLDPDEVEIIVEARLEDRKEKLGLETPAPPPPPSKASSSTKRGKVRKCPNCGGPVEAFESKCESCGHEFVDVDAVSSVETLSRRLDNTPRRDMPEVIAMFPVPNTREDLLEFIVYAESKFLHLPVNSGDGGHPEDRSNLHIVKAFKAKYIECVEKAKIYFPDDPKFKPLFRRYKRNLMRPRLTSGAWAGIGLILFLIADLLLLWLSGALES